jgi:hypothetical protein
VATNQYPNDENYPLPSFRRKITPPDVDPDAGDVVSASWNDEWTPVLEGALQQLMLPSTWEGTPDEIRLALNRSANLRAIIGSAEVGVVPAPYWDEESGDDTSTVAPIDDQPWYGQIVIIDDRLTFVENAFIYVVAGFIAYSGLPTAAVSFIPIARQFVVTVKSDPLGGIVRFLADAVEIGRVDTYAAADGVIDVPLTMPAPSMGFVAEDVTYPTLWVELLEDNPHDLASVSMTVIRRRLSEADFSNPSYRYNSDCDCVQYSPDGGTTWNDAPGNDPRHSPAFLKPPVGGSSKRCDAAANMVKWLKDFIDYETAILIAGATVTGVLNAILLPIDLLFPGGELLGLLLDLADLIFGVGGTALATAFTSDQYDLLLCIFYCNIDSQGRASADALATIESDITAQLNTTAALVTNAILFAQGEIGLSNAGAIGSETGDCDACDCGWCYNFDFASSDGGWTAFPDGSWPGGVRGAYSGGAWNAVTGGSVSTSTEIMFKIAFPATGQVTKIEVTYSRTMGEDSPGASDALISDSPNSWYDGTVIETATSTGGSRTWVVSTDTTITTELTVWMFAALCGSCGRPPSPTGSLAITSVKLRGTGDNPFGSDNC